MTDTWTSATRARRLLAVAITAAPILLLAGTAALPAAISDRHGTDRAQALHVLQAVAPDRDRLPAGLVLVILGLGALVAAAFGLAGLAGGSRLSLVGVALVAIAAPAGAATNAVTDLVAYRLTDPELPQSSAVDVFAASLGPAVAVLFLLYALVLPGMILLAVAAWRAHVLAWWPAALIGLGVLLGLAAGEGPVGALFSLPLCLGMLLAARRLMNFGFADESPASQRSVPA
jgi:hypothetical protein